MSVPPTARVAVSGQDCPQSGLWQAQETSLPPLLVPKGAIMPGVQGRVVTWVLTDTRSTAGFGRP
jgi:hypothetical protein